MSEQSPTRAVEKPINTIEDLAARLDHYPVPNNPTELEQYLSDCKVLAEVESDAVKLKRAIDRLMKSVNKK